VTEKSTVALEPAAVVTEMLAGHWTIGAATSLTITVNEQMAVILSVALQFTFDSPTVNGSSVRWSHKTGTLAPALVAKASNATVAFEVFVSILKLLGQTILSSAHTRTQRV
jgi:hypothetical protein